jgi:hypothetical protein
MSAADVEGTAVELDIHEPAAALPAAPAPQALAVTPPVKATDLVERLAVIEEAMHKAMKVDVDYGLVPGTDKPTLFKPGAEKLSVLFQLDVQLTNEKVWGPGDHLTVLSRATVYHAPSGARLGYGEGLATTKERKHAKRKQERTCPACGAAAVIKGKAEYGGGWLCWKKRDGCGAKYSEGDPQIEGQPVGEVENPDLPDLWNTVVKMAEKRARVDAVLAVTGASALFTQDVADEPAGTDETPPPAPSSSPPIKDFERTGESDVTPADPWLEHIQQLVTDAGAKSDLRQILTGLHVAVPERVSSWRSVLATLDAEQRARLEALLQLRIDKQADVPWVDDEAADAALAAAGEAA